ncbi:hypothetical protein EI94DRAFT_1802642 [Lactarius quietus]|nr:hypothetical protein EI94DRAFT_1802642 [Lactarius quietus]
MGNSSPQPVPPQPVNTQDDESVAWFLALDQDNSGQISAEELRCALMNEDSGRSMSLTSYSCDVLLIPRVGAAFSFETVKYLMSVFDLDGSGEIGLEEFKPLWVYVTKWREMFESFDYNQDGIIDAAELESALNHYQLQVGRPVINFLVHKYGTRPTNGHNGPPQIELDRFVCACVVVQQMCALYGRCEDGRTQPMEVSRDEFLLSILRLP